MPHFFISYAKKDTRELALALDDALNKIDGVTAWADRSLRVGQDWNLQIQEQIDRCDTMIVLYSPDINRHKRGEKKSYVLTEIAYAMYTAEKPIIPVMAQKTEPPIDLTTAHYINFTLDGMTLNVLVERICNETGLAIATPYHVDDTIEDELYKEAVELVRRLNKASAPLLQRRLRIGYSRAAALIDMMEERGVVGPQLSESKPREVLPERSVSSTSLAMSAIIGDPFDWCEVPAGEFLYSRSKQNLTLPAFVIAKYPITYAQFQTFIDAPDGFFDNRWWGGLAVTTEQRQKPGDQQWKINMHPRENVSWYDAIAFCRWLSYKLGGNFDLNQVTQWTVRLPTAYEWEKAARGTDGRIYPYGDDFDEAKSNTDESGIKKTTPVTQYPQGASPYGALDMSGNVWEWCLTNYHHPTPNVTNENLNSDIQRFLRGGSWQNAQNDSRCTSRGQGLLPYRSANLGFRICAATV